ncbi:protein outspread-like [Diaphorina citri]|uniref:Protein outspread-like n=1 Tax=Diaphorina citri TaxID=121845 RepID=A0A3Q0IQI0_DIACI|nr:protein outspread-like [Diaphorina citri]
MSSKFYSNGECKKFQPNIFNKIKCTYCFKPKEEHSNEALESNRVTKKAVKCGYLFVAPFSDFSNPINKTKRWQRRWFVLYDDGELKYALDDYPETVPQACIDMNKVLDVQNAEERTSHPFSISINTGESIHYVKATCREEAQWWSDVLNSFRARKSKATGVASTPYSTRITSSSNSSVWESGDIFPTRERDVQVNNASNNENNMSAANVQTKIYVGSPPTRDKVTTDEKTRIRSSSNRSSPMSPDYSRSNTNNMDFNRTSPNSGSEFSRTSTNNNTEFSRTSTNASEFSRAPSNNGPEFSRTSTNNGSEFSRTSTSASDFSRAPSNNGPEFSRTSTNASEFSRTSTNNASESSSTRLSASGSSSRLSASGTSNGSNSRLSVGGTSNGSNSRLSASDGSNSRLSSSTTSNSSNSRLSASGTSNGSNSRLSASGTSNGSNSRLSASGTSNGSNSRLSASGTSSGSNSRLSASGASNGSSTRLSHSGSSKSSSSLEEASKMNGLSAWDSTDTVSSSPSRLRRSSNNSQSSSVLMDEKPVRGDPDGCGLDLSPLRRHSPTPAELRLDLTGNTEHYLNMKKGWLMKQSGTEQTWTKHWFVLRGCSLLYYRDPKAEESGVLDGVVALNNVTSLSEVPVARNFGFQITTWDSKRTILSAVTAGIRNNWMSAIKRTAAMSLLDDKASPSSSTVQQSIARAGSGPASGSSTRLSMSRSKSSPPSSRRSTLDSVRASHVLVQGRPRGVALACLCPAPNPRPPPLEDRPWTLSIARAGSGPASGGSTRLSMSRSKSSPPSSRRSTLDSVRTEDLSLPCCGELPEPELLHTTSGRVVEEFDNLRSRFEKAVSEIRVMKRELRLAQSEQDCVELSLIAMSQELKAQQERSDSQTGLMASKIQDLTLKLSLAEKQELPTDCGDKSSAVERPSSGGAKVPPRIRRKSLDSVNEPPTADPMKILFRVTDLEKRIGKASGAFSSLSQIDENEKSTGGKARSPAEKSRPSFDTPSIVRDEVDASPSGALDLLSSETGLPEHRGSVGSPRLFPPKPKFICSSAEPERSQDEEQHTSLLHSIEYEVLQIENLVREHSHSLSELELADSSLNDTAWIADLSVKCVEIKQQIVSLQEYLKQNELGAICSRCCETNEDPIPCKQCAEFSHQLREKEEHCEAMEKLCRDQEEALRRKEQEYRELCERCGELESSEQTYKERLER